jgi:hypothetical protein
MVGCLDGLRKAKRINYKFIFISQILCTLKHTSSANYLRPYIAALLTKLRKIMRTLRHKNEPRMSTTVTQETITIITGIAVYQLELLLHVDLLLGATKMETCIPIWRT